MNNKPFTLILKELEEEIIKIINNANIPIYCLKQILSNLYNQLDNIEKNEIEEYQKSIKEKNNKKKAGDK